ncbi:uncharacterized protein LOC126379418 [Pectinophora gossypiella]|uniref:uncharacterized protein LOC126379418 n=1 Tax=Pectinophora gossypiella TaxID=13191 RepID=UPI00214E3545|nr:uncharacterized protein LOC126379418 [Pectinophora gossypiella]XP_049884125.1 uncharacterized protein LOC126379418 [Pectinophora gossypiella]XP_049884126.1 uncharacterized protein LOC126379418 [Pectinophora gossypiella]XP_049884127.1 uncharacterized protein LOC126379418 [Pectinophora gossypiella]
MKVQTMAGTRTLSEPPRSTAYYYADLERLKRKEPITEQENHVTAPVLDERRTTNDVIADAPIREVPPLRDRQWSLPEYHTPENSRKEETYSTAGTFPMPEPREKEPLLAELEVVGRLPLTQLESSTGVRRSRSWYLCCPNVPDEEISRESSWRYSSLRPVTAPPLPGQNGLHTVVATQSSGRDDLASLRSERDALARALAAERGRAAAAARAHDARLAELHGVIAELVRRRAQDKHAQAIPEEELSVVSDECESTTQPAGELDNDADRSRTEQNDTSSALSPDLPTPQDKEPHDLPEDTTDTSTQEPDRSEQPRVHVTTPTHESVCDHSLHLSDSELCLSTARCCQYARHAHSGGGEGSGGAGGGSGAGSGGGAGSCDREHGSNEGSRVLAPSPGRCESRQAKLASRVRLRKTEDTDSSQQLSNDEGWMSAAAERLALDVCAQAGLREALVQATNDGSALSAAAALWRARCARLQADARVLHHALARATDTAHRLSCACAVQESSCVALCCALRAADRALEVYDVLLALAETTPGDSEERLAAERVARQLLSRLEAEAPALGEPLLSPGPWLQHTQAAGGGGWSRGCEARLRARAAALKADTVALRNLAPPPGLFSYHDIPEEDLPKSVGAVSMADMEAAVVMQELLSAREARAAARAAAAAAGEAPGADSDTDLEVAVDTSTRRRRPRHWLDTPASETDL